MKASYAVSRPSLPSDSKSRLDLLVSFQADAAATPRRNLNISLVIDRSGSMAGGSLKQAIKAAQGVVDRLVPADRLSVVIYDDAVETILAPQLLTDKAAIRGQIGKIRAGGCTNLIGGWQQGAEHVAKHHHAEHVNRVLLLTDGQANVGLTDPKGIQEAVRAKAAAGVATTTLGFGSGFNEDLLMGMASVGKGNFYFVQSPEDAEGVFEIELEGLASVVAQNLQVTLRPASGVKVVSVLNQYRTTEDKGELQIAIGDLYGGEDKQLGLEVEVDALPASGSFAVGTLHFSFQTMVDGKLHEQKGELPLRLEVGADGVAVTADPAVAVKTGRLRIAKVKNEAISFADKGELVEAARRMRQIIDQLKASAIAEKFEIAEELDHLDHYATQLEKRGFDQVVRKEMLDQSYQARTRSRGDLSLRGTAGSSTDALEAVAEPGTGIVLRCEKDGGKLRIRVSSDGYDKTMNVQFPRAIREEGATYVVDTVTTSADGSYYRVGGKIRLLVLPGQERKKSGTVARKKTGKASTVSCTAADLPTVTSIGDGILVQCVKEKSKLRARVVSDGYDPNFNMRFPRSIREEGILYVVDEVILGPGGNSYIACGDIKRLIQ